MKRTALKADPEKVRAWQDRSRKPLARQAFWSSPRGQLRRKTALAKRNVQRAARRLRKYKAVLASDFHKKLRYDASLRSGGLCECEQCVGMRDGLRVLFVDIGTPAYEKAWTDIPVWFTKRGKEPWQRFRSKDGELHHVSYAKLGQENPDELRLVRWVWKSCHARIEAEHGTRRRYLTAGQ